MSKISSEINKRLKKLSPKTAFLKKIVKNSSSNDINNAKFRLGLKLVKSLLLGKTFIWSVTGNGAATKSMSVQEFSKNFSRIFQKFSRIF